MVTIELAAKVMSNETAEMLVERLALVEEGGWNYVPVYDHKGPGLACVKCVDEFGETVGWL
jgi:hypothetical protein